MCIGGFVVRGTLFIFNFSKNCPSKSGQHATYLYYIKQPKYL